MKIIYYGHFHDWSGYGKASRDFVLLLEEMGHDVYCKSVDFPEKVIERGIKWHKRCERRSEDGKYDLFIIHKSPWNQDGQQELIHEIPDFLNSKKRMYFTVFETSLWPAQWKDNLEHFDHIITFSTWQKAAALNLMGSDWKDKISVVPHVVETAPTKRVRKYGEPVVFYSEFSRLSHRKGLDILLKSYYNAFSKDDNCILRIKIPQNDYVGFNTINDQIKNCFNYKTQPKIDICSQFLTDRDMEENFDECDVFVCTARGEGFCLPLATAAVKGLWTIAPFDGKKGFSDYIKLFITNSGLSWVFTDDFHKHGMKIDTSKMQWFEPLISVFSNEMKDFYYKTLYSDTAYHIKIREFALNQLSKKAVIGKLNEVIN